MREGIILEKIISIIIIFLFIAGNVTIAIAEDEVTKKVIFDAENGINTFYIDDNYNNNTTGFGEYCFNKIQDGINKADKNITTIIVHRGTYDEDIVINKTVDIIAGIKTPLDKEENISRPVNIEKTCDRIVANPGDTVTYTIKVENTAEDNTIGNLTLVSIKDSLGVDLSEFEKSIKYIKLGENKSFKYNYKILDTDPDPLINTVEVHYLTQHGSKDVSDNDSCFNLRYNNATITGNISIINESVKIMSDGIIKFNITGEYFNILSKDIVIDSVDIYSDVFEIKNDNINISNSMIDLSSGLLSIHGKDNLEFYNDKILNNIEIAFCDHINLTKCVLNSNYNGTTNLFVNSSKYSNIQHCNFSGNNMSSGIEVFSCRDSVYKFNKFADNYSKCVLLFSSCYNLTVHKNNYNHSSEINVPDSVIYLEFSNYNEVTNNSINVTDTIKIYNQSIRLKYSNNNSISNNSIHGPFFGNATEGLNTSNQGYGIRLVSSNANIMTKNKIVGVKIGVAISQSKGNLMANNEINECRQAGISLSSNIYNVIFFNTLNGNYQSLKLQATNYEYIKFNDFITNPTGFLFAQCVNPGQGSLIYANYNYWGPLGPWGRVGLFLPQMLFFPWCGSPIKESKIARFGWWFFLLPIELINPMSDEIQYKTGIKFDIPWE